MPMKPAPDDVPGLAVHEWPNGTTGPEHLWDKWHAHDTRRGPAEPDGPRMPTEYRTCLHPRCKAVGYRLAAQVQ